MLFDNGSGISNLISNGRRDALIASFSWWPNHIPHQEKEITATLYPNPTNSTTYLKCDTNTLQPYTIAVNDIQGRCIQKINSNTKVGVQSINLEIEYVQAVLSLVPFMVDGLVLTTSKRLQW